MSNIHPTAIVHKNAKLGKNVSIGPYSIIGENVTIEDNTEIGAKALIEGWTRIGENCKIYGASLGTLPQDLKYRGEKTELIVGNNTVIREYATLNVATGEGEKTIVGDNCLFMAYSHVAHNCVIGNNVILANAVNLAGHVFIEDFATVGGVSGVHQFVHIGKYAFIGGMSRVTQDILPYIKVAGNPLRLGGLNSIGLRRRGFSNEALSALKKAYKLLFRSDFNTTQAVEKIKNELPNISEIFELIDFIKRSHERVADPNQYGQGLRK